MDHFAAGLAAADAASLPLSIAGAVLVAAHAAWNAIAHGISDKLVAFTLHGIGAGLCAVPLVVLAAPPDPPSRPYLAVSVAVHLGYNLLLMRSCRLGDFSQVYPLARGTSPLVVTVMAAALVGEVPAPGQAAGMLLISGAGLPGAGGAQATDGAAPGGARGRGLRAGDRRLHHRGRARRAAGRQLPGHTAWLMLLDSGLILLLALALRGRRLPGQLRSVWHVGLLGGAGSILAYGLVLWAQTRAALGPVAALRETGIVFGAVIGTLVFHERFGRPRIAAAVLVAAGALTLNLA